MREVIVVSRSFLTLGRSDEALWVENVRFREIVGVVTNGILTYGDVVPCRDLLSVYNRATMADFAPESTGRRWCKAHGFL